MSPASAYRPVTDAEIQLLVRQNCHCPDWSRVAVTDSFDASAYSGVTFNGDIRLGRTDTGAIVVDGIEFDPGIHNATLINVSVGDGVHICNVSNYIANYDIADGVFIRNVDTVRCRQGATFGVGTQVSVLNETGGREVPVWPGMSAHVAYMMAMYRHDPALTASLRKMADAEVEAVRSDRGAIGRGVRITDTDTITDVNVGDFAVIESATRLQNGTLASVEADPVKIGANVIADDFIALSGAQVTDGASLRHVFVGQATHLSHLFSAHDSLFFSNCACENGEAAAVFAGPYTVTMHKSSLLIAGMFSFLNAGSGSNQSNHMYKLGPIHQGIVERGSKTTSDSYILWPAHIGPFSLVMGRHVSHPDTSALPFSYLIEDAGVSHLVPGANLKSVGTVRDAQKWPRRDRRRDPNRLDHINFNLLSPYTVQKMMKGVRLLDRIEETSGPTSQSYSYQGMSIKASSLRKGRGYYRLAIDKFMGNSVIKRLENCPDGDTKSIRAALRPTHHAGAGLWYDLSGLIVPRNEVVRLCGDITGGVLRSFGDVNRRLASLAADYYDMEWTWVASKFASWYGKPIEDVTAEDIRKIVERWKNAVVTIDNLLYEDARKEFSLVSRTGFGLDNPDDCDNDFRHVRGEFENDPFVLMVTGHIAAKTALGDELLVRLDRKPGI